MDPNALLLDSKMFLETWWISSGDEPEKPDRQDGWVHCPGPHRCLMPPNALSDGSECCVEASKVPAHIEREALAIRYQIDLLSSESSPKKRADVLTLVCSFLRARYEHVCYGPRAGLSFQEGWARRLYSDIESWAQICAEQE